MPVLLTKDFFARPADTVARELLGHTLCARTPKGKVVRLTIHETEAYMGPHDLACHASKGRTARTDVMFREAGTVYIYLIYGIYFMLNVVTGTEGFPAAVLIRGAGEYDGPGKLTRALMITNAHNALLLGRKSGIWIERGAVGMVPPSQICTTPRIGVSYAKEWAEKELRFVLKESI